MKTIEILTLLASGVSEESIVIADAAQSIQQAVSRSYGKVGRITDQHDPSEYQEMFRYMKKIQGMDGFNKEPRKCGDHRKPGSK